MLLTHEYYHPLTGGRDENNAKNNVDIFEHEQVCKERDEARRKVQQG